MNQPLNSSLFERCNVQKLAFCQFIQTLKRQRKAGQSPHSWIVFSALSIGRPITEIKDGLGIVCF